MPANLTAEAKGKWEKVAAAKTPEEKLRALQEFLSSIPKHKGNENLRDQTKRKIASLRRELEHKRQKKKVSADPYNIEKEGAAQILLIGPTNAGRSSLLSALTNAKPLIAPHPYTTTSPTPGMMPYGDIKFMLVEIPAFTGGKVRPPLLDVVKKADGIIIVLDLTTDAAEDLRQIILSLEEANISLSPLKTKIEIEHARGLGDPKIFVSGRLVDCTAEDLRRVLLESGLRSVVLRIFGDACRAEVEVALSASQKTYKPAIVLANKSDLCYSPEKLSSIRKLLDETIPVIPVSSATGAGLDRIAPELLRTLRIIRVYTKEPDVKEPLGEPFILKDGASVGDLAKSIHSQLFSNYKYARVWGPSCKFPGEKVGITHILADLDIVEIHTK